jgi:hypothetical protein
LVIISFSASEIHFGKEDGPPDFLIASLAGEGHYVNFQSNIPGDGEEDCGIHFEVDDQGNSGYEVIEKCVVSPAGLRVTFRKPKWDLPIERVEVQLDPTSPKTAELIAHLRYMFTGRETELEVIKSA